MSFLLLGDDSKLLRIVSFLSLISLQSLVFVMCNVWWNRVICNGVGSFSSLLCVP